MWIKCWSEEISKWWLGLEIGPVTLIGDALSMTLVLIISILATLAYGL